MPEAVVADQSVVQPVLAGQVVEEMVVRVVLELREQMG